MECVWEYLRLFVVAPCYCWVRVELVGEVFVEFIYVLWVLEISYLLMIYILSADVRWIFLNES